jgi:hypothetical protein
MAVIRKDMHGVDERVCITGLNQGTDTLLARVGVRRSEEACLSGPRRHERSMAARIT